MRGAHAVPLRRRLVIPTLLAAAVVAVAMTALALVAASLADNRQDAFYEGCVRDGLRVDAVRNTEGFVKALYCRDRLSNRLVRSFADGKAQP